jgi:hypothetical protein
MAWTTTDSEEITARSTEEKVGNKHMGYRYRI